MKLSPGELIEQKYRILRRIGTGGMGSVYEAENTRVERRVAIKVMHKARDPQEVARFEREARAAQIGSPHIVQVFDLGYLPDGAPYMVMEYLAGESLGERLQGVGALGPKEVVGIAKQILDGLGSAHRAGIIHRDLKPDNVFLVRSEENPEEVVKLLDFGISKFTDAARKAADVSLTRSGVAVGTPHYMSPEQVQGKKELDTRTDLYSLGVILYRCLSGQLPFKSEDVAPLLVQILLETPKSLCELYPGFDVELSGIVARAMARQADERFQTAAEFRAALVAWESARSGVSAPAPMLPQGTLVVPSNLPQTGTNAPWASTAAQVATPSGTTRNLVLATTFFLAGAVGLGVAYRVWSSDQARTNQAATTSATAQTAVGIPALVTTHNAGVASPVAVVPVSSELNRQPSAPVGLDYVGSSSGKNRKKSQSSVVSGPTPASLPPSPALPPAQPAPAAQAAHPPDDDGADNRHMSRGVQ